MLDVRTNDVDSKAKVNHPRVVDVELFTLGLGKQIPQIHRYESTSNRQLGGLQCNALTTEPKEHPWNIPEVSSRITEYCNVINHNVL